MIIFSLPRDNYAFFWIVQTIVEASVDGSISSLFVEECASMLFFIVMSMQL